VIKLPLTGDHFNPPLLCHKGVAVVPRPRTDVTLGELTTWLTCTSYIADIQWWVIYTDSHQCFGKQKDHSLYEPVFTHVQFDHFI